MENSILSYDLEGIGILLKRLGQPHFRAKQLVEWIYRHGVTDYDQMSNLPASLRSTLAHEAPLAIPRIADKQVSADGARKYVLQMADGQLVETVGIPSHDINAEGQPRRLTVCFSTQVGCPMGCAFCATGTEGFTRNLLPGEMAQQLLCVQRDMGQRVSNVVAMGQGEPFLNYENLLAALRIMNSADALDIGARHITVSTCGITNGIESFGREPEQFTLAISLHAARQEVRDRIMPRCIGTPLPQLKHAIAGYYEAAGRRTSLEYLMIKGINDSPADLKALISFCKELHVHINLLPMNAVDGAALQPSSVQTMNVWMGKLERAGIETTIRTSRGSDIDGACGQLKNKKRR